MIRVSVVQTIYDEKALKTDGGKEVGQAEQVAFGAVEKCLKMVESAAETGTDLIVTTEAVNHCLFYSLEHIHVKRFKEIAEKYNTYIVAGLHTQRNGKKYNSALLFGPTGNIEEIYDKIHLPAEEAAIVSAGEEYKVVETRWGRLGLLICWDLQFPEAARILALKGADIIACPTLGWEDIYGLARAYENSLYIAAAMGISVNYNVWNEYMGTSCIVNPMGKKVTASQKVDDDIISAIIDVSMEPAPQYGSGLITGHKSMRYTRTVQRRADTYGMLTEEKPPVLERYQKIQDGWRQRES